jgi:dihydrofolate reductase
VTRPLAIVVALAENGAIGRDNRLIWRLKTDLRRFREVTWGKPLLMGRRTFESIGRPLPGRETIVLTRGRRFASPGILVAYDWDEAVAQAEASAERMGADEIAVVGGAQVYQAALPFADRLRLTLVHAAPEGDTFFPDYDRAAFREVRRQRHATGPDDEHPFTFIDLERRRPVASR